MPMHPVEQQFIKDTATVVAKFLKPYIDDIENTDDWKFCTKSALDVVGYRADPNLTWFSNTVALKAHLRQQIDNLNTFDEKYKYAEYFITKWGSVSTNKNLSNLLKEVDSNIKQAFDRKL